MLQKKKDPRINENNPKDFLFKGEGNYFGNHLQFKSFFLVPIKVEGNVDSGERL